MSKAEIKIRLGIIGTGRIAGALEDAIKNIRKVKVDALQPGELGIKL